MGVTRRPGPCPNPRGWYHSVAGIRDTPEGLVATYRLSDSHTALFTHIMTARSRDGGRTWEGHRSIAHRNVWEHQACWVAPQLSRLRDGRLVVLVDEGHRSSGQGLADADPLAATPGARYGQLCTVERPTTGVPGARRGRWTRWAGSRAT